MVTVHFMHIGKTGGTAIKNALSGARLAYWRDSDRDQIPPTPYGPIKLEHHDFRLEHLPDEDYVFFCVRDPVARFVSAFLSRRDRGWPSHSFKWSKGERRAFETFHTPQHLAMALGSEDPDERAAATRAMREITHLGYQRWHTGRRPYLRTRLDRILYVARQETLDADWEQLKSVLGLPADVMLPHDPAKAHRRATPADGAALDDAAVAILREWYAPDYRVLRLLEKLRAERGWGVAPEPRRGPRARRAVRARTLVGKLSPRRRRSPSARDALVYPRAQERSRGERRRGRQ